MVNSFKFRNDTEYAKAWSLLMTYQYSFAYNADALTVEVDTDQENFCQTVLDRLTELTE